MTGDVIDPCLPRSFASDSGDLSVANSGFEGSARASGCELPNEFREHRQCAVVLAAKIFAVVAVQGAPSRIIIVGFPRGVRKNRNYLEMVG